MLSIALNFVTPIQFLLQFIKQFLHIVWQSFLRGAINGCTEYGMRNAIDLILIENTHIAIQSLTFRHKKCKKNSSN